MLRTGWEAILNWVYTNYFAMFEEIWSHKTAHINKYIYIYIYISVCVCVCVCVKPQLKEPVVGEGTVYRTSIYICFSKKLC